jgi:hypothetical protein
MLKWKRTPEFGTLWLHSAAFTILALIPGVSLAVPTTYDTGPLVFQIDYSKFIGTSWNTSQDFGGITCPLGVCGGAQATVDFAGKVGFNFGFKVDSGSVNASVQYSASAALPDPSVGTAFFNLNPNSTLNAGTFSTSSPNLEANVDGVLNLKAGASGEVCYITGCSSGGNDHNIINFSGTQSLVSFNQNHDGTIDILGSPAQPPLLPYNFDSPIGIDVGPYNIGNATLHLPQIQTSSDTPSGGSLTSNGQDDLLTLTANITNLMAATAGLPPLNGSVDFGIGSVSYNIADLEFGPILDVKQDFELTPTLWVDLKFDNPVLVAGNPNPVMELTSRWDSLPDIAMIDNETNVTPTFFVMSNFTNQTALGLDLLFDFSALSGSLDMFDFFTVASLGPLFSYSHRFTGVDFPPLFNQTFALGGFNTIDGTPFTIRVPEPASLLLLAVGLLAVGLMGYRQQRAVAH